MKKIAKIGFNNRRIFMQTTTGKHYSRPLEAFPRLLEATPAQREAYRIGDFGDDVRWEEIDEDIHVDSFFKTGEPEPNNPVSCLFKKFPQLNVSQVSQRMGMNKSLMAQYIYGTKKPSEKRLKQIEAELHQLGKELLAFHFSA